MSEPITILRLTPAFDWRVVEGAEDASHAVGGMEAQVALQVQGTAAMGVGQEVITLAVRGAPESAKLGPSVSIRAVGDRRARGVHRRNASWLLGVLGALRRRQPRPDVVHVHASGLLEPLLACLAARVWLRRPIVLTLHGSALATYVTQSWRDAIVQVPTRAAERLAIRVSTRTLVLTERVARALGASAEVMPDWVEVDRFANADMAAAARRVAARYELPSDRPVALFVGRVSREKGWPALLTLAERFADRRLHVLVCGDGADLQALVEAANARGVSHQFTFAGAVSRDDVAAAMAAASVLVLPSIHEELGSVLIEAMASGLPAVAYNVGGVAEALQDGITGLLVPARDDAALADAVRRVLDDQALRRRARVEGPRLASARFDALHGAERLTTLYRRLAA